jgi:biopolymer transport protein ExbB/TolQ
MAEWFDFLAKGGIIMVPIAVASLLGTTVILERLWILSRSRIAPAGCSNGCATLAQGQSRSGPSLVQDAPVRWRGSCRGADMEKLSPKSAARAWRNAAAAKRSAWDGISKHRCAGGHLPPFGLLGTVTGMISVFSPVTLDAQFGA